MINKIEARFDNEFKNWDKRYKNPYKDVVSHEIATRKKIIDSYLTDRLDKDLKILEIGCGTANVISNVIDQHPTWQGYGLDISENMIEYNKKRFPHIEFRKVDLDNEIIWNDEKFDIIICAGVIGYLKNTQKVINNIHSQLNENGELFISFGNKSSFFRKIRTAIIGLSKSKLVNHFIQLFSPKTNSYEVLSVYKGFSLKEFKSFVKDFKIVEKEHYSFCTGAIPIWWILQTRIFELITSNKWGPGRDIILRLKKK